MKDEENDLRELQLKAWKKVNDEDEWAYTATVAYVLEDCTAKV
jgi:hypothetical protein